MDVGASLKQRPDDGSAAVGLIPGRHGDHRALGGIFVGMPTARPTVSTGDPPRCEASREGLLRQGADFAVAVLDAGDLELGFA